MAGVFSATGLKELIAKYGKVALGVHLSVSAASITGCYVAIKNNVDVGAILHRAGLLSSSGEEEEEKKKQELAAASAASADIQRYESLAMEGVGDGEEQTDIVADVSKKENSTRKSSSSGAVPAAVVSSGGAWALAFLCNKALIPVRVPITIALTPTVARLLARRNLYRRSP